MRPSTVRPLALALAVAASGAVGTVVTACASSPATHVSTTVAPDAQFGRYRTFTIMTPRPRNPNPAAADDPMVENSITNRALRDDLRRALEARGYTPGGPDADFSVAYYAAARQTLDVQNVDYGYPFRPWWFGAREQQVVTPITQGTVVVDVIDQRTKQLVWRGTGRAEVSDDQAKYTAQLERAVNDVVQKLPRSAA